MDLGSRLGPYQLVARLGAGGMGAVYRARDTRLQRDVAVKVLLDRLAGDASARARFEREARAVAALAHPNIVAIFDIGSEAGHVYLVTELLVGRTLQARLEQGPLPVGEAVSVALGVAAGLAAAHAKGVIHRDLKPGNIFLTENGPVKLLDFGLAKRLRPEDAASTALTTRSATVPGIVMGTPPYMSPEQARGQPPDHRTDIFSLGVVLYEMLTGDRPFAGGTTADVLSAVLRDQPPSIRDRNPAVPPDLDRLVRRCLQKSPSDRFQAVRHLMDELQSHASPAQQSGDTRHHAATGVRMRSIAVLPFADLSMTGDQAWFCEGMADEIMHALSRVDGVRVASRTSAFRLAAGSRDARRVGTELDVDTVLEGSVRRTGQRLRIVATLVNAMDGYQIWSERYDRDMQDVFEIQDDIAVRIVGALRGTLSRAYLTGGRYTPPLDAYHAYLKGVHNWYRRDRDSLTKAAAFFQSAAEADPAFELAHLGVANAYSSLGFYGLEAAEAAHRAGAAIERAAAIDDTIPEFHAAEGLRRLWFERDWPATEASFGQAIAGDPHSVLPRCWFSFLLDGLGRHEEALEQVRHAQMTDPLAPYVSTCVGLCYVQQGRYDTAIRELQQARDMEPDFLYTHWVLGGAYGGSGQPDRAVDVLERAALLSSRASYYLGWLGWAYGLAGRQDRARAIVEELADRSRGEYVSPMFVAWAQSGLGDDAAVYTSLEEALADGSPSLFLVNVLPALRRLRGQDRFTDLLRRLNLPA